MYKNSCTRNTIPIQTCATSLLLYTHVQYLHYFNMHYIKLYKVLTHYHYRYIIVLLYDYFTVSRIATGHSYTWASVGLLNGVSSCAKTSVSSTSNESTAFLSGGWIVIGSWTALKNKLHEMHLFLVPVVSTEDSL